jgi:uncharacterized repeat protein (TIGR04076 family)
MKSNSSSLNERTYAIEVKVHIIKGVCPVYKIGDKVVIDDPRIILEKTDALCTHALSAILRYATVLQHKWCPISLGLTTKKDPDHAYIQCIDPGKPYTEGGTVFFCLTKIEK